MTDRSGSSVAGPARQNHLSKGLWALLWLFAGFVLVQTPPAEVLFSGIASILATVSVGLLQMATYDMVRNGIELRDAASGHAIAVTSACDGHGLMISAAAVVAWLRPRRSELRPWWHIFIVAGGAILAFNLARIILLFVSIGVPTVATAQHLFVAPLLSVLLVAAVAFHASGLSATADVRSPMLWLGVAGVSAILWYLIDKAVSCLAVVPIGNAILWLLPGRLVNSIACDAAGATLVTHAAIAFQPLEVITAEFHPNDFTIALPFIFASLAIRPQPARLLGCIVLSLILFAAAMVLAAITTAHDQAIAAEITTLRGQAFSTPYEPPGELPLALMKAGQNALVHFNLFLLPLMIAAIVGLFNSGGPAARPFEARRPSRRAHR